MKWLRWGQQGEEKPGLLDSEGIIRDLSAMIPDIIPNLLTQEFCDKLENLSIQNLPKVDAYVRLGPCLGPIGKIICIGCNSLSHEREMGLQGSKPRKEPIIFLKPGSSLAGPNDSVCFSRHTQKLDWEAELAVIIGRKGKYIPLDKAEDYIYGYACFNDLSERYLQFETEDNQFTKGKCFDNSAVLGPYLVTKDEIKDPNCLSIKLWVNGMLRQDYNSSDYLFNPNRAIHFLSQYFTLHPGDVISMGSGPGTACSWNNQFLQISDELSLEIEGLGRQLQRVVADF